MCEFCSNILQNFSLAVVITEISNLLSLIKDAFMKQAVKDLSGCLVDFFFFLNGWSHKLKTLIP